ncbi:MAG: N-6 DNA methylase [Sumerlaeia bacterium]
MTKANPPRDYEALAATFCHRFREVARRHSPWSVFQDFLFMSAATLSNRVEGATDRGKEREADYLKTAAKYRAEELEDLARLLSVVALAIEAKRFSDFLGKVFHQLELHNRHAGQFFTPSEVSWTMARMQLHGVDELIEREGFLTLCEPACGAGSMILAAAGVVAEQGWNEQEVIHVTAIDLDRTAALMAYVQLSLHGIPALVYIGDSLRLEFHEEWATPQHHLGFWLPRLRARDAALSLSPPVPRAIEALTPLSPEQLSLFDAAETAVAS